MQHRHGLFRRDSIRQAVAAVGCGHDVVTERSLTTGMPETVRPNSIADGEACSTRSGGRDHTRDIAPHHERQRHGRTVHSGADQAVDRVDGHCFGTNQHVRRSERRHREVPKVDDRGRAELSDEGCQCFRWDRVGAWLWVAHRLLLFRHP
jgi:hypothetical protein